MRADNLFVGSSFGARVLLVVGFLAAWIGYDAWIVSHVVLDPHTTRAAAHALLDTPAVQRGIADSLTDELDRRLPLAAQDPHVPAAIAAAVRDPRVAAAFADTVTQIHQAIVTTRTTNGPEVFTVNGRALSAALHDALVRTDPLLATQVAQAPPLVVHFRSKDLPHLHDPRSTADVVSLLAIAAALLLITASLILQHDRKAIGRAGRRTAMLAAAPLLVFVVVPRVLVHATGDAPQIASALLRAYGNRVVPSALAFLTVGLAIMIWVIGVPRRRRHADATRNAFTPYTGPPASTPPGPVVPAEPTITEKLYL